MRTRPEPSGLILLSELRTGYSQWKGVSGECEYLRDPVLVNRVKLPFVRRISQLDNLSLHNSSRQCLKQKESNNEHT